MANCPLLRSSTLVGKTHIPLFIMCKISLYSHVNYLPIEIIPLINISIVSPRQYCYGQEIIPVILQVSPFKLKYFS